MVLFDTVDHDVLIEILNLRFGVVDCALDWFRSYLSEGTQSFCTATETSKPVNLNCSIPQGSDIGLHKFIAYTEDSTDTIDVFSVDHHLYADDTQLQKHMRVCEIQANRQNLAQCVVAVGEWYSSRRLQLNPDKTVIIWFSSRTNIKRLQQEDTSLFSSEPRRLHVPWDEHAHAYRQSGIGMLLSSTTSPPIAFYSGMTYDAASRFRLHSVAVGLLQHRVGWPTGHNAPFMNAAIRLVAGLGWRNHVTPAMRELHWLPVVCRIKYTLCVLMHASANGRCAEYISEVLDSW